MNDNWTWRFPILIAFIGLIVWTLFGIESTLKEILKAMAK